jgi:hypothetical protein
VRLRVLSVVVAIASATTAAGLAATPSQSLSTTSQLDLRTHLRLVSDPTTPCPPGSPDSLRCPLRTVHGPVIGLGAVTHASAFVHGIGPPWCSEGNAHVFAYPVRWVIPNKGEIDFAIAETPGCFVDTPGGVGAVTQAFTVSGGRGIYAGASGSGHVQAAVSPSTSDNTYRGFETWTGTLSVPGLDFDVTAPVLTGATNKTVTARKGAKGVRVTYDVTARDAVDGEVAALCSPRSGGRFKVGRTPVTCSASDTSANTGTAKFRVTVKPAR